MGFQDSIFQVSYRVQSQPGNVKEDWFTAFCCSHEDNPVLVTARHAFMKSNLEPELTVLVRAVGDEYDAKNEITVHVIAHPVADIAMLLPQAPHGRTFVPLQVGSAGNLQGGEAAVARGFLGNPRNAKILPGRTAISGMTVGPPKINKYGQHQRVKVETTMPGQHGLSGAPVFLTQESKAVIGVYAFGYDVGAWFICASQIKEL